MAKRLQLEQWKSQMLRNLNMFVSRVRLVIHNLPASVDDAKLRQLFKNHSNRNAVITEVNTQSTISISLFIIDIYIWSISNLAGSSDAGSEKRGR